MLQFNKWQTGGIAVIVLLAIYFSIPNFLAKTPTGFVDNKVTLGLDLQGGSHLLLQVNADKVVSDRLDTKVNDIRDSLRGDRNSGKERIRLERGGIKVRDGEIKVTIREDDLVDEALDRMRRIGFIRGVREMNVTLEGKTITASFTDDYKESVIKNAVSESIETIRRRIDSLGTREPTIVPQGNDRIVLQVPGDDDPEALISLINRTGQLNFHMVDMNADQNTMQRALAGNIPGDRILVETTQPSEPFLLLEKRPRLLGSNVEAAYASPDPDSLDGTGWQIGFELDGSGTTRFAQITRENVNKRFAIVLDGVSITAPNIREPILGGSGSISGSMDAEEANEIAILINSGALPAELNVIEQRSVGPDLGEESVRAGAFALILGFAAVVVYMVISYGRFGVYANIALIANMMLLLGALSILGSTLTLPGIAGIVLTVGMAVDANVLIFERIREEVLNGKKAVQAVELGYQKAWSAIVDANITTFLAAAIMYSFGAGPVRGFAITLGIGVMTSVFSAYIITRLFAGGYVLKNRPEKLAL